MTAASRAALDRGAARVPRPAAGPVDAEAAALAEVDALAARDDALGRGALRHHALHGTPAVAARAKSALDASAAA